MSKSDDRSDWLNDLQRVGIILFLTPGLSWLPLLLYAMLVPSPRGFGIEGGAYATGNMMLSGVIIMVYAAFKRGRREALRRHDSRT